jgi:hypothetical protein
MGAGNRITPSMIKIAEESKTAIIGQGLTIVPSRTEMGSGSNYNINSDRY